jgi:glucose/mannose-6-phosphate isomerase
MEQMRQLISDFPDQMRAAWRLAESTPLSYGDFTPSAALILGMGGSGIGGAISSRLLAPTCSVPVLTSSDYVLPRWVGPSTFVLACSYSGSTEETLAAVRAAHAAGARIGCITSGGELGRLAAAHGWPTFALPGGHPPRSQFGYAVTGILHHLHAVGLAPASLHARLGDIGDILASRSEEIIARAEEIADAVEDRQIWLYSDTPLEAVAIRLRQQLNENSKLLVCHHVFPEMNHNELVGWESGGENDVALILTSPDDHPRTRIRMEACAELMTETGADVVLVEADGDDPLERVFDLVHVGDWLSLLLAERAGVDPIDIRNIDLLKRTLAEVRDGE